MNDSEVESIPCASAGIAFKLSWKSLVPSNSYNDNILFPVY